MTTTPALFLTVVELQQLTGRKTKSKQIEWLRREGVPFRVNAIGHPVVTRVAIEGPSKETPPPERPRWAPRLG